MKRILTFALMLTLVSALAGCSVREGPWEYDFEIHAETGEILSWEKDD